MARTRPALPIRCACRAAAVCHRAPHLLGAETADVRERALRLMPKPRARLAPEGRQPLSPNGCLARGRLAARARRGHRFRIHHHRLQFRGCQPFGEHGPQVRHQMLVVEGEAVGQRDVQIPISRRDAPLCERAGQRLAIGGARRLQRPLQRPNGFSRWNGHLPEAIFRRFGGASQECLRDARRRVFPQALSGRPLSGWPSAAFSTSQVAPELGLHEAVLRRWVRDLAPRATEPPRRAKGALPRQRGSESGTAAATERAPLRRCMPKAVSRDRMCNGGQSKTQAKTASVPWTETAKPP